MGILKKGLAKKHEKLKIIPLGSVALAMSVLTGFELIDYNTATICETGDGEEFLNPGLPFGKIIVLVGNSQGGKTTLGIQIAHNMVKDLNGDVVILDYERSSNNLSLRYRQITGCTKEEFEETVSVYNHVEMSTEFFKQIIFEIAEMKKALKKADMADWISITGEDIKIYPPTVVLLDAIPSMKPVEVLTDASLDNNMVAGKMAAANSNALKSIVALLETYNITVIGLNHITTKIVTNKYAVRKVQLPGLGEDENLPGETLSPFIQ